MEPGSKPQHINPSVLVIVIILSVVFICSGLLHMLARCLGRRRLRRARGPSFISPVSRGHLLQQLFSLPDCGVEQAVINTLPVFVYGSICGLKDSAECAVCLSEFRDEDRLRLLPPCKHAFHVRCIDAWLHANSTCPLCRRSLLPEATEPAAITAPPSPESNPSPQAASPTVRVTQQADGAETTVRMELGKVRSFGSEAPLVLGTTSSTFARSFSMGEYEYVVKPTHRSTRSEDLVWATANVSRVCSPSQLQSGHQHHSVEIISDPAVMVQPEKVVIDVGRGESSGLLPPSASLDRLRCPPSLKKSASLSWLRCDSGSSCSLAPSISLRRLDPAPEETSIDVDVDGESSKSLPSLKKSASSSWLRGQSSKVFCAASSIV